MTFLKSSLVRGLIGQVIGTVIGMALAMGIRLAMGLPAWKPEPVWTVGALFGVVAFIYATGVLNDWLKWVNGKETPEASSDYTGAPGIRQLINVSYDHKVIGMQYGVTSLIVFVIAGIFALIFRTELASPGIQFLVPDVFNTIITLHGIVMIYGILLGVGAMSNYLVPLLIGANDMAFPRLNAFAYWINVPAGVLLLSTLFLGGIDAGWTGYPPLSAQLGKMGFAMFFLGVYVFGLSSILGSLNVLATVLQLRAPGMTMFRMPIFVWSAFATAIIALTATQLIGLSFQMVLFERLFEMDFFNPLQGGHVLLFQHLFWFYSHPAVYVFVLAGLGVISELLPVFVRKPLYGYRWVAMSSLGIALIGFFVWAHHMFASGMASYLRVPFTYTTMLVAVPTGVKFFSWTATIWRGKMIFPTPMLFVLGAISIFLLGGLSGPPNATVATDLHLTDTYFIVGHFHATMFGGYVFPFFAAIYYWFPKMTGRVYNEAMGKVHFWMMLLGFYVQSLGQMQIGLLGMRRRIADYDPALGITFQHQLITIAGYVIALGVLIFFINMAISVRRGRKTVENPWNSRSPEWQIASPAPAHNYASQFEVVGEPYDYGLPGSVYTTLSRPAPAQTDQADQSSARHAPAAAD
ncbi:MAG: cytochrome C oxidase subunit I [Chloroflexi bacterium RBG_16_54_18]|nr:MAG: cytochrome C oxidase subunit I [Chloroflexi bacterium RBG_16_54_18]